mgnify:CR=1 FL=1
MELFLILFVLFAFPFFKVFLVHLQYKDSKYQAVSGNSLWSTVFNKGNYGEFLTFRMLEQLPGYNKLLTNIYIPKNDGSTTEIDLLMINKTGIYVFESKNYGGWIFGDDKSKNWTQTLSGGKKNRFFNPIFQNKAHINALKNYLKNVDSNYFYSYIVFSERCTLKKISVNTPKVYVLKRNNLPKALQNHMPNRQVALDNDQIDGIYTTLKKHSLVDDITKQQHIKNINGKLGKF